MDSIWLCIDGCLELVMAAFLLSLLLELLYLFGVLEDNICLHQLDILFINFPFSYSDATELLTKAWLYLLLCPYYDLGFSFFTELSRRSISSSKFILFLQGLGVKRHSLFKILNTKSAHFLLLGIRAHPNEIM